MAKKASRPAPKKKKVHAKPKSSRKMKAKVKKSVRSIKVSIPLRTLEEVSISKLTRSDLKKEDLSVLIELLYNLTPSTRNIGYNSGFHVGILISQMHNSSNSLHPLLSALGNAGFSDVLYYPHKNNAVIEATHHQDCKIELNATLHIFEAGMIAGYISHSTGAKMSVVETRCAHGSKGKCYFVIEPSGQITEPNTFEGTSQMEASIKMVAISKSSGIIPTPYFMLAISPLTKSPVREQLSKLLFMIGQNVSKELIMDESHLENLAPLFSIQSIKATRKAKKLTALLLNFKKDSSVSNYSDLISPFFSGLLYASSGKLPKISSSLSKAGNYISELKTGR